MNKWCIACLGLILYGCDVTYIADSADPRLPHFSTIGRNAAGAYVNDEPWLASCGPAFTCNNERLVYFQNEDFTELRLPRTAFRHLNSAEDDLPRTYLELTFKLGGNQIEAIRQVRPNHPLTIALDGGFNSVEMRLNGGNIAGSIVSQNGVGQLHIRHVESIASGKTIVAGTFGFVVDDETGYYKVRSGRFDFRFAF